ncbi:MAG: hypothetical protein ACTS44_00910 [Candidatus Hodgkinia cicadicola]
MERRGGMLNEVERSAAFRVLRPLERGGRWCRFAVFGWICYDWLRLLLRSEAPLNLWKRLRFDFRRTNISQNGSEWSTRRGKLNGSRRVMWGNFPLKRRLRGGKFNGTGNA